MLFAKVAAIAFAVVGIGMAASAVSSNLPYRYSNSPLLLRMNAPNFCAEPTSSCLSC